MAYEASWTGKEGEEICMERKRKSSQIINVDNCLLFYYVLVTLMLIQTSFFKIAYSTMPLNTL